MPYSIIFSDKLLIAVFDGFFLGAGIDIAILGGSVIGGTEIAKIDPDAFIIMNSINDSKGGMIKIRPFVE